MIKILIFGDIVGKPGRQLIADNLDRIRREHDIDFTIANGENTAGGFGITEKIFARLTIQLGIDCITTGNHWADKRDIYNILDQSPNLLIPGNMGNVDNEAKGLFITQKNGIGIAVINLVGQVFMHPENRSPFATVDRLLDKIPQSVKIRVVDFHTEASSEKQALAHYLTARVSMIYGTHTHVPTADERIFQSKTGYITDVGMTGPYDSIIGMKTQTSLKRFLTGQKARLEPAKDGGWLCYLVVTLEKSTGHCLNIQRFCQQPTNE